MTMSGRERHIAWATGLVLAAAGLYVLLVEPALDRLDEIDARNRALAEQRASISLKMRRQPELRDEILGLEERITASAPEMAESDFNAFLESVAQSTGLEPSSVQMVKRQPLRDDFEEIVLALNLESDMGKLTDYLVELEKKSERLVKISRLSISRQRERDSSRVTLTTSMVISTVVKSKPEAGETPEEGGDDAKG